MGYKRYRLHVVDLDPSSVTSGGWLEDTSLVEKYKISDEAYQKRDGQYPKTIYAFVQSLIHLVIHIILSRSALYLVYNCCK